MASTESELGKWLKQHQVDYNEADIQKAIQKLKVDTDKRKRRALVKKLDPMTSEEQDYDSMFDGLLEPRPGVIVSPPADGTKEEEGGMVGGSTFEPVSEEELAESVLQKAKKLGSIAVSMAQAIIDEHDYTLLLKYAEVLNKDLVSAGVSSRGLVKTHKRVDSDMACCETPRPSRVRRPNWSRKLLKHDYRYLYRKLVDEGYIEDSGEAGFLYYFAGIGSYPKNALIWRGEKTLFAVLIDQLSLSKNKRPWALMGEAFPGLDTKSLPQLLSKAKKQKKDFGGLAYSQHCETIQQWLK